MSGIVGAIGEEAQQAVPTMCELLAHRGGVHYSASGTLTDGSKYAMGALGLATLSEASQSRGSIVSAIDKYNTGYAQVLIIDSQFLVLDRDVIGSRPLFYGAHDAGLLYAFASERKALWSIGIRRVQRVDPQTTIVMRGTDEIFSIAKTPDLVSEYRPLEDESQVVGSLRNVLECVLRDIVNEKMSVAFSGGVDSALLSRLITDPENHQWYAVGLPGSHDLDAAQRSARLLHIDLQIIELDAQELEMLIPCVIEAIESCNPLDVAIALPFFALARKAQAAGFTSILTGQGADELFAGYHKYTNLPAATGEALRNVLESDVLSIARDNLERDNLTAASHALDVALPYLDPRVVAFGFSLDPSWKLRDGINKYVLRKVAEQIMPAEVAYQPKKAIQYGTGINTMLLKLAHKNLHTKRGTAALKLYLRSIAEKQGIAVVK